MSSLRSLQREVIRNQCKKENGNLNMFQDKWTEFHYKPVEVIDKDGKTTSVMTKHKQEKKKHYHYDDRRSVIQMMKSMKQMIDLKKQELKEAKEMKARKDELVSKGELVNG